MISHYFLLSLYLEKIIITKPLRHDMKIIYYMRQTVKLLCMAGMIVLASCNKSDQNTVKKPQPCKVMEVTPTEVENKWYYVGELKAQTSTSVNFRVPGVVKAVYVSDGDYVAKGQLLAMLDPQDMQRSYDLSKATLTQAEDAMARVEMMHQEQSVADIKYVEVQTKLEQARTLFQSAEERLNNTKLYAPVSGYVSNRTIEPGESYGMVVPAFKILDVSKLVACVPVPEREIPLIKKGDKAQISVLALGDDVRFEAVIDEISASCDRVTHSYEVRLAITNADRRLKHGMVCNVQLWPGESEFVPQHVLPVNAVINMSDNQKYVWVIRDGVAHRRKVSVGMYTTDGIIIQNGLNDGDFVVVEGQSKLSEGMATETEVVGKL